eukprot:GHVN01019293.1.p1 GENE.GHVN01019293.1~~GHVN01019293.1.p1  ORF type:complete len:315 (+),score=109.96 GHVN01019293.1:158-1102(+)
MGKAKMRSKAISKASPTKPTSTSIDLKAPTSLTSLSRGQKKRLSVKTNLLEKKSLTSIVVAYKAKKKQTDAAIRKQQRLSRRPADPLSMTDMSITLDAIEKTPQAQTKTSLTTSLAARERGRRGHSKARQVALVEELNDFNTVTSLETFNSDPMGQVARHLELLSQVRRKKEMRGGGKAGQVKDGEHRSALVREWRDRRRVKQDKRDEAMMGITSLASRSPRTRQAVDGLTSFTSLKPTSVTDKTSVRSTKKDGVDVFVDMRRIMTKGGLRGERGGTSTDGAVSLVSRRTDMGTSTEVSKASKTIGKKRDVKMK